MILAPGFTEHESVVWAMALFALERFRVGKGGAAGLEAPLLMAGASRS